MSKSGNKINYSLRLQKNVERKIFGDIIRSLNYFMPIDKYRYIGFGSFYFQDFVLFFEDFAIREEISIEKDRTSYVKSEDVVKILVEYFIEIFKEAEEKTGLISKMCFDYCSNIFIQDYTEVEFIMEFSRRLKEKYYSWLDNADLFPENNIVKEEYYDYSPAKVKKQVGDSIIRYLCSFIIEKMHENKGKYDDNIKEQISSNEFFKRYDTKNFICPDIIEVRKRTKKLIINRYQFNKPYGFIEMKYNHDVNAIEELEWKEEKKNIIWLDYDEFLNPKMLESLEKCIKKTSSGSLIILSVCMEQKAEDRLKKFQMNFKIDEEMNCNDEIVYGDDEFLNDNWSEDGTDEAYRILNNIDLKACDSNAIHSTLYNIIDNTVSVALNKKNTYKDNDEAEYKIQQIFNCVYSDGMPMFTYGIFIYSTLDDENDENFPTNVLKQYPWLKTNQEKYEIKIPALTHKEVNAINQLLPHKSVGEIKKILPFIPLSDIEEYVNIYRYYPHFFEVGDYV